MGIFNPGGGGTDADWTILGNDIRNTGNEDVGVGLGAFPTLARLEVEGAGNTSATSSFLAKNSDGIVGLDIEDGLEATSVIGWTIDRPLVGGGNAFKVVVDDGATNFTDGVLIVESNVNSGADSASILIRNLFPTNNSNAIIALQGDNNTRNGYISSGGTFTEDLVLVSINDNGISLQDKVNNKLLTVIKGKITFNSLDWVMTEDSPTQLTVNTNNWAIGDGHFRRISSDAAIDVTGIVAVANGTQILFNVDAFTMTFKHQDASSAAANRFLFSTGADIAVPTNGILRIWHDEVTDRWRDW